MALPAANTPWPPPQVKAAFTRMDEHRAWYAGDPRKLADHYGKRPQVINHTSQLRGGIVGALARMMWGRPVPLGQTDTRLHTGVAGDLAATSSDLLFAEPPTWRVPDDAPDAAQAQARLDLLAEQVALPSRLAEGGEVSAALGGVYLRAAWDEAIAAHPLMQPVYADRAVPEFAYGILRAVSFVTQVDADGSRVLRHVERHEPGSIEHGLYEGAAENLGSRVDLRGHTATAGLPATVTVPGGLLAAAYSPNMLPNPDDTGLYLGRSDYRRSESLMDALDEVYTSWMRDIRLAKGRLVVPGAYLENHGPGQGATFDTDREVFESLNIPPMTSAGTGAPITVAQFAIRVEEHRGTARDLLTRIVGNAGYAASTFGLDDQGQAVTATEIKARERRSFYTRGRKAGYWRPALAHMARVLLAIDAEHFRGKVGPDVPVTVDWPDGVSDDLLTLAQTATALRAAEAASDETIVRLINPDWDDPRVKAEVAAIGKQREPILPDPGAGFPA